MTSEAFCFTARSQLDTEWLACNLANLAKPGDIFLLKGELGTGKTTFTKAFANALGFDKADITSPSFTIIHEYQAPVRLVHADLYRLGKGADILSTGLEEYLDSDFINLIEWAEYMDDPPCDQTLEIQITISKNTDSDYRYFKLTPMDKSWANRLKKLKKEIELKQGQDGGKHEGPYT